MTLLLDQLFRLKSIVKIKLDLTEAFLQFLCVIDCFLAELVGEFFVFVELITGGDFNIAVLFGFAL